jgi:arylsulfatase A-like enzyme
MPLKNLELNENTLIIFMSDNGGAEYTFATDNGRYKGGKITDLEGGVRVPLFMTWKGRLPAGMQYENPVVAMDMFASIVALSGAALPTDRVYDGVNLMPYLTKQKTGQPHDYIYWKRGIASAVRDARYKMFVNTLLGDTLLFDLQTDPYESTDLYPTQKETAQRLARALHKWEANLPEPLWPAVIYYEFMDGERRYLFDQ